MIPKERTAPALDLSVLFNGFKPLFTALTPADVNQFAFEVIKVLQGEGGTIESLLAKTASLTTTLADADQVIGDLITNLTSTLQIVSQRQQNFSQLLVNLQQFITGLSQDINPILNSLGSINSLNTKTAGLLQQTRVPIKADLDRLRHGRDHARRHPGDLGEDAAEHAGEAEHDDPDRVVRLLVQLLPVQLRRQRHAARWAPASRSAYDNNSARCKKP